MDELGVLLTFAVGLTGALIFGYIAFRRPYAVNYFALIIDNQACFFYKFSGSNKRRSFHD
ncbi:MAG: hypothetical protein ABFD66_03275 [Smithella sp.]